MATAALPSLARDVVADYLASADREAPGLVEGLYLVGSAALGDFRPGTSDLDFVAVTARALADADFAALARAHAALRRRRPRPCFDGLYVTREALANDPMRWRGAHSHEGRFHAGGAAGDPVTWHTLARHGIACRGPAASALGVLADAEALAAWTLDNLDRYWRPLLARATRVADPWGPGSLLAWTAVWIVLGISRLHYTLATGDITSKTGAGRWALGTFPERWHRVVREALDIRAADRARPDLASALSEAAAWVGRRRDPAWGRHYASPFARRREVLAFGHMVIDDAIRRS